MLHSSRKPFPFNGEEPGDNLQELYAEFLHDLMDLAEIGAGPYPKDVPDIDLVSRFHEWLDDDGDGDEAKQFAESGKHWVTAPHTKGGGYWRKNRGRSSADPSTKARAKKAKASEIRASEKRIKKARENMGRVNRKEWEASNSDTFEGIDPDSLKDWVLDGTDYSKTHKRALAKAMKGMQPGDKALKKIVWNAAAKRARAMGGPEHMAGELSDALSSIGASDRHDASEGQNDAYEMTEEEAIQQAWGGLRSGDITPDEYREYTGLEPDQDDIERWERNSEDLPFQGEAPIHFREYVRGGDPENPGRFSKVAGAAKKAGHAVRHPVESGKKVYEGIRKIQGKLEKPLLDAGYSEKSAKAIAGFAAILSGNPIASMTRVVVLTGIMGPAGPALAALPMGQVEAGAVYIGAMLAKKEGRPVAKQLAKDIAKNVYNRVQRVIRRKDKAEAVQMQGESKMSADEYQKELLKHCGHMTDDEVIEFTLAVAYAMDEGESFDDALDTALKSMAFKEAPE